MLDGTPKTQSSLEKKKHSPTPLNCMIHSLTFNIYAFSRRFYPKRLKMYDLDALFVSMCVPWELNPQTCVLLTQCFTTEPQEFMLEVCSLTRTLGSRNTFGFRVNV